MDTNLSIINTTAHGIEVGTVPTVLLDAIPVPLPPQGPIPPNTTFDQQPVPVLDPPPVFPTEEQIKSIPVPPLTSIPAFFVSPTPMNGMQILGTNPQQPTSGSLGLDIATPSVAPINTINVRGFAVSQIETYAYKSSQSGTRPQPFSTRPFFGWRAIQTASRPRGFYETNQTFPDGRIAIGPIHYNGSINIRTDGRMDSVKEDLNRLPHNNPSISQPSTIAVQSKTTGFPAQKIDPPIQPAPFNTYESPDNPQTQEVVNVNPGMSVTPANTVLGRADKSRFQLGVQMDLVPPGPVTGKVMIGQPSAGYPFKYINKLGTPLNYAVSTVPASQYGHFGSTYLLDSNNRIITGARLDSQKSRGFIQGAPVEATAVSQYDPDNFQPGYGNSP